VGESVQRNLSNTIPSAQLITPFLNVKMETLKLCSFLLYFLMIISPFRLFYTVITFYYAFCGATFSRHAVSLNSQCHFTQTCLHEKKSPSKRKENARTYFFKYLKKNQHSLFTKRLLQLKPNWISKTVRYTRLITKQPTSQNHVSSSHASYFWERILGKEKVVEASAARSARWGLLH